MNKKIILCAKRKTGRFLLISSLLIVLCISVAGFAGCGKQEEHTHAFTEQNVKQTYLAEEATCTQAAKYYFSCTCGEKGTQTFAIGNALGHNFGEWQTVTPATEEKDGLEERTCTRCEEKEEKTIPAIKHTHNYVETVVEPTCTTGGYTLHKCACGEEYKDNEKAALGHNFGEWVTVTPATEEKDGLEERNCTRCKEKEEKTIPAIKHTHVFDKKVATEKYLASSATCTQAAKYYYSCACGERGTEIFEYGIFADHTEVIDAAVAPTKTTSGLTEGSHCGVCGKILKEQQEVPATGSLGLTYSVNEDGTTCTVTGIGTCTDSEIIIPKKSPEGYTVTKIGNKSFADISVASVTIPDSVTSIGSAVFQGCSRLESIIVSPNNTKYHSSGNCLIETESKSLISGCNNSEIPTDGSVTSIGNSAFYVCRRLTSITIPDSVTSIGRLAFYDCSGLTSITIPDSVTSIGDMAFEGCSGLMSVTIPDSVTSIGIEAFSWCSGLTSIIVSPNNKKYHSNGNCLIETETKIVIAGCKNSVIPIDGSVTSIGNYAFEGCSGLTSITIPDSVTSIGREAFAYCSGLRSVTIPDSVTSIGNSAFSGCSGLTSIVIPDSVTSIGYGAFDWCDKAIIKRNGISYIDKWVIDSDYSVAKAEIRSGTVGIADGVFFLCSGLTSVTIPDSVTSIGNSAFSGCSGLTSVTIPDSVTSIGDGAFSGCSGLTSIIVSPNNKKYHSNGNCLIETETKIVIAGCKNSVIPIDGSVTSIGDSAFSGCSGLTSVVIPDSVTSIGGYAFNNCSGLTSVVIPDSVTSIEGYAFSYCSGLTSITIPDSVASIGDGAFYGCSGLTEIHYNGTMAQWKAISKKSGWDSVTGSYTIYCTDGNLTKDEA